MADRSFLDWPVFDDRHRRFAAEFGAFVETELVALVDHGGDLDRQAVDHGGDLDRQAVDHGGDLDRQAIDLIRRLGDAGYLRYTVPAPHGGIDPRVDVRTLCLAREILAYRSGLADTAFVMQGLGSGPIALGGSAAQKAAYLPPVAAGRSIAALGMSEPDAGSDVANMKTAAVDDGDAWVLNGTKTWISNAGIADQYCIFAVTEPGAGTRGIGAFVVEAGDPGFSVTERIELIAPHPLGTLRFVDCRIPKDRILGAPGDGFKLAMANLDIFRSSVGAAALGFARRAMDEALARCQEREAFGEKLAAFQLTQAKLADMATDIDASALLVYRAAWTKDVQQRRVTREASMAKMYATEAAQRVVDQAVQLFGGLGVTVGVPVEQLYREVRALRIYEGTTEINKLVIARQVLQEFNQDRGR